MDILDQSEVDKLLAAVVTGGVQEARAEERVFSRHRRDSESVEIRSYDFKRPERVSKDQMRALQTLHESFARNFGASLSGFLRTIVEVRVATCEQMTYSEFISGLPNPTSFNLIEADGLDGQICLEVSPLIVYPIIDRLLGGTSHDLFIPQRPMTQIETRLISNVTNRGLAALSEAWESIRKLTFKIAATESNPQLVQIVPPNEVVLVVGCELKMANRAGTMNLCIPYNVIEPVMEALSAQSWFAANRNARTDETQAVVSAQLAGASVSVTGVLAETTITVADLKELAPGDLILTEKPAVAPVVVQIGSEKKFLAHLGQYRGSRALRVLRRVKPGDRV
ncbi:MAG: flagellar motor switch protein FliM [Phycisphaeraceae bacterium]|nr:flagellar motor switch protein FliM [Phycisphaeraceae bacterium]MCW5753254.1 flagellar motor switch protein FliM [Phycisphaeraceae bacterium]